MYIPLAFFLFHQLSRLSGPTSRPSCAVIRTMVTEKDGDEFVAGFTNIESPKSSLCNRVVHNLFSPTVLSQSLPSYSNTFFPTVFLKVYPSCQRSGDKKGRSWNSRTFETIHDWMSITFCMLFLTVSIWIIRNMFRRTRPMISYFMALVDSEQMSLLPYWYECLEKANSVQLTTSPIFQLYRKLVIRAKIPGMSVSRTPDWIHRLFQFVVQVPFLWNAQRSLGEASISVTYFVPSTPFLGPDTRDEPLLVLLL